MSEIRVGIIGLGVGEQHIPGYRKHPDAEVVSICDFDDEKLRAVHTRFPNIEYVSDADKVLSNPEINLVSIAGYDNYHAEQIVTAIRHRKHIFVEKPLCLSVKEAHSVFQALKENPGIKISSNLILRKSPRFQRLKDEIRSGRMGAIYYLDADYNYGRIHKITEGWRGLIPFYSVVYGGSIHLVDLFLWLTGKQITRVYATGTGIATKNTRFKYPDTVAAVLEMEDGIIAKVTSNYSCVQPHFHQLSVYGTKATFINQPGNALFYRSRDPDNKPIPVTEAYPGVQKGALLYDFVDAIIKDRDPEISRTDIFHCMAVCFAIEQSRETGVPVEVEAIEKQIR